MLSRVFSFAVASTLLLSFPGLSLPAFADKGNSGEPIKGLMLGGIHVNSDKTPIAYIYTEEFVCSGTLVATNLILTAGHCIEGNPEDYEVYVGGDTVGVVELYMHESYDPEGTTDPSNSRYDLGMLVLDSEITSVPPIPVATAAPIFEGLRGNMFGFGSNELSYDDQPEVDQKVGKLLVGWIDEGMFETYMEDTNVADCSGDSGGPVIAVNGARPVLIGVVSTGGSDNLDDGTCIPGDGTSQFVDIQTDSSVAFLDSFDGGVATTGDYAFLVTQSKAFQKSLTNASKQKNLSKIKQQARGLLAKIGALKPYADKSRDSLLDKAISALRKVASAKSRSQAASSVKSASNNMKSIAAKPL